MNNHLLLKRQEHLVIIYKYYRVLRTGQHKVGNVANFQHSKRIFLTPHTGKLIFPMFIVIKVRGKKTTCLSISQGHPTTFHWFSNKEREKYSCSRIDVRLLVNHLESPNVAPATKKQLRKSHIKDSEYLQRKIKSRSMETGIGRDGRGNPLGCRTDIQDDLILIL